MKTLVLREKGQRRLGDKQEFFYTLEQAESSVDHLVDSLRQFISQERKSTQELLEPTNEGEVVREFEKIRRSLGVCAGKSQQDVWGFVRLLLKSL